MKKAIIISLVLLACIGSVNSAEIDSLFVSNNVVYILSDDTLTALSEDGILLWKTRAKNILTRANGVLYVVSDGYLKALDQYSGEEIWKLNIVPSYLRYSNNLLYAYNGEKLKVLDKRGLSMWETDASSEPLFSSGIIYLRSNGEILALNQYTGEIYWSFKDTGYPLFVSNNVVYILSDDTLTALSEDGILLWKTRAKNILTRANGVLYVVSNGYLKALDQYSGEEIWEILV